MPGKPKISVLMTAWNAERFIGEAIESVLNQTFTDFEFLIINDGSSDRTGEIIRSYRDERIRLVEQDNKGIAASLNLGLHLAKADLVARFDADDVCYPERLQQQYQFISNNTEYSVIGSAADYVDEAGEFVFRYCPPARTNEDIRRIKSSICPFIHSTVLYRKDFILKHEGY